MHIKDIPRKEVVKILRRAKKKLLKPDDLNTASSRRHNPPFICWAVEASAHIGDACAIKNEIRRRLQNCCRVEEWLVRFNGIPERVAFNRVNAQTYRHLWVDHLIKEFSE